MCDIEAELLANPCSTTTVSPLLDATSSAALARKAAAANRTARSVARTRVIASSKTARQPGAP